MFRVYINPAEGRVLVAKSPLEEKGWVLISASRDWEKAYRKAAFLADLYDFVLEWDPQPPPEVQTESGLWRSDADSRLSAPCASPLHGDS
ncbi:MAG: hypothetical protein QXP98_07160 [Thermoproteus sp.]